MPGRIIYIRNPSSGSNFRTLQGTGTRPPKTKTPKKPRKPKTEPPPDPSIGQPIYSSPGSWIKKGKNPSFSDPLYPQPTGDIWATGPETTGIWGPEFIPPESLIQDFYDIFIAQLGERGNIQWPVGTPGTLRGMMELDAVHMAQEMGVNISGNYPGEIPNTNLAHNRYDARPWWTQYKQPSINYNPYWFLRSARELDE